MKLIKVGALSGKEQIKDICYSIGMSVDNVETIFTLVLKSQPSDDSDCFVSLCDNEDLTVEQLIVVAITLINSVWHKHIDIVPLVSKRMKQLNLNLFLGCPRLYSFDFYFVRE